MENNEIAKRNLILVGKLNDKLKQTIERGAEKLSAHCSDLKSQIKEISSELQKFITESNENLLDEIQAYEKNFFSKFDLEISNSKIDITNLISRTDLFCCKWSKCLNDSYVYEKDEASKAKKEAHELSAQLENEICEFEKKALDENLIQFVRNNKSLNTNLVGDLFNQNYNYVTKLSIIQFEDVFQEITRPHQTKIEVLKNGKYIIMALYEEKNYNFKVICFDADGNFLKSEDSLLRYPQKLRDFKMVRSNETVCMYFSFIYGFYEMDRMPTFEFKNKKENIARFLIIRLDENLRVINKINVGFSLSIMCAFEENIYILSNWKNGGDYKMFIFDWSLKQICELGTENNTAKNENVPFRFPKTTRKIEINTETFFLLEDFKLRMMDRKSGEIKREILFNSFRIFLSLNKYILTFNNFYRILYYYDLDGNLLYAKNIKNISHDAFLVSVLGERLIFLDSKSKTIYNFSC